MNVIRYRDRDFAARLNRLAAASSLFDPVIEQRTRAILEAVAARGDDALLELTGRFDGAILTADQLPVGPAEFMTASLRADKSLRVALAAAVDNISRFAQKFRRHDWWMRNAPGEVVGEK